MASTFNKNSKIVIIGAGIFGLSTALELHQRGYKNITVVDPSAKVGANPLASSTDISKIIRSDYASDIDYVDLHTESFKRWAEWNKKFGEELYHETGMLLLSKQKSVKGDYMNDSYNTLQKKGYPLERLTAEQIKTKYPLWNSKDIVYQDAYVSKKAGWAESGRVVGKLLEEASKLGIKLVADAMQTLITKTDGKKVKVLGVKLKSGSELLSDLVLVCAGAWTPLLLPHLESAMMPIAQPVFHFSLPEQQLKKFEPPNFLVYTADIENTGFYGFPAHPHEKVLKIGHHGRGYPMKRQIVDKESLDKKMRSILQIEEKKFRQFIEESLPAMKDAKTVYTRLCMYCDSFDGNFFIGRDPEREGLAVAAGGSGHGFKFGPVLGEIIADSLEGKQTDRKSVV